MPPAVPVRLMLAAALLMLSGCEDALPTAGPATPGAAVGADGRPAELLKLAENRDAKYTDVAVAADGTVHAIYQAPHPATYKPHVYHRQSGDGGATWSEPLDLMAEDTTTQAGFVRLAIDGQGRVYAFWKTYAGFDVVDPSGGSNSTLAYRARVDGAWTPVVTVGEADQVMGWFPAVAPDGQLHVIWSETIRTDSGFSPYWEAGSIRQAAVSGGTVGASQEILRSPELRVGTSPVVKFHGYRGLRGYVDAAGVAHFTALKTVTEPEVGGQTDPSEVVHWDGAQETRLFQVASLEAVLKKLTHHPPTLYLDAEGREHLVVVNQGLARPAVQDYAPPTAQAPTVVYQLASEKGDIRGAQIQPGPLGRAAVILQMHDTGDAGAKHDLWAATFDGRRWAAPVNVTNNAAREDFMSKQTSTDTAYSRLLTYSAQYGAGAFDPAGRLNLTFINTEIQSIMRETSLGNGDTGGAFGSSSQTNVYFHKL